MSVRLILSDILSIHKRMLVTPSTNLRRFLLSFQQIKGKFYVVA